ncbi:MULTISPECIES: pyridoxamine 5'-phosphate oxidase family protein [unclassified Diaminobutyricimonas]|uniref:pyridoxamine 5'-phosphate oxidase family protein n=1 Tax=unclassified Diaminobutyricimonas TaxID=2643261 RepID=UPI0012F51719|nr:MULTISPECIES: pyridoxamine 5'-phosphate oxidase family protein [unclassified Diaminobutyricimonas]
MTVQTWLVDLSGDECARLLEAAVVGRLGVVIQGRPEIFPVSHVYDAESGSVAFPTGGHTKIHAALEWPWVAYEIDGLDESAETAWSVQVVGRAEEITDLELIERLSRLRAERVRWISGESVRWLRIVAVKVSGRRIQAVSPE